MISLVKGGRIFVRNVKKSPITLMQYIHPNYPGIRWNLFSVKLK